MNVKILESISCTFKNILVFDIIIQDYIMFISHYQITRVTNVELLFLQMRLCLSQWGKQCSFFTVSRTSTTIFMTDGLQGNISIQAREKTSLSWSPLGIVTASQQFLFGTVSRFFPSGRIGSVERGKSIGFSLVIFELLKHIFPAVYKSRVHSRV